MASVAVLGCGPAGLMAAHAVRLRGHEPRIFAPNPRPSHISGAQYLHSSIQGLTGKEPDGQITYQKHGTREEYARKIYGFPEASCSWDLFDGVVDVWSLRPVYERLWKMYRDVVADRRVEREHLLGMLQVFDAVVVTAPRWQFQVGHAKQEHVWIVDYGTGLHPEIQDNTIIYMGEPYVPWYRASKIFGYCSVEWPDVSYHPHEARHISKPISFETEEKLPGEILFTGRYGLWQKGVLVDDAFEETLKFCKRRFG